MPRLVWMDYSLKNFHAQTYLKLLREDLKARGWELVAATAMQREESQAWAHENHVPWVDDLKQIAGQFDGIMILSPSHAQHHLRMVEQAVQYNVPIYVDKTFAPDYPTAVRMFELADQAGLPMITTSALRYTDEVAQAIHDLQGEPIVHVQTWGTGPLLEEYLIHPLEMAISIIGHDVLAVRREDTGKLVRIDLTLSAERAATINFYPDHGVPYVAVITTLKQSKIIPSIQWTIFRNTLSAALDFFEQRKPNIDRRESLIIRRIMDIALCESHGRWIKTS